MLRVASNGELVGSVMVVLVISAISASCVE
jgi:hypothetical protein